MWNAYGGSERRTIDLYRALARHGDVKVWSEHEVKPELAAEIPIQRVGPDFPRGGVLAVIGVYFDIGPWLRRARPVRTRLVVNTPTIRLTHERILRLLGDTEQAPEIVYCSEALARKMGFPGTTELSMIDTARFAPAPEPPRRPRFTVGRLSRDFDAKHHPDDPSFYRELVEDGCDVRIMGGTVLTGHCGPGVTLLPAGAEDPVAFLRSLDCFYYRTAPRWFEAYGRVLFEAMACGVPVVCHRRGGYRVHVRDGHDAFLFDTPEEARAIIRRLRDEPELRASVGREARATVLRMYEGQDVRLAESYFGV
jgi:glycosyltransferase involved in cell wall biosynthesis